MANSVFLLLLSLFYFILSSSPTVVDASGYEVDFRTYLTSTTSYSDCRSSSAGNGECSNLIEQEQEQEDDLDMDSESNRRMLYWRRRYISYGALIKDRIPCARRGVSYYSCHRRGSVNPYFRGCSRITRCRS